MTELTGEDTGKGGVAAGGRLRISPLRLAGATAVAGLLGLAANGLLYALGLLTGSVDGRVALPSLLGMGPLSLASVSATTLLTVVGAGALLAVLSATTRRPIRIHRIVVTVLAAASLAMPATIPGPPPPMRLTMVAMHVVVWAVCAGVLATLAGRPARGGA